MALPDFQSMMLPILRLAAQGTVPIADAIVKISDEFCLSENDRCEKLANGRQTRLANRVAWAFIHLAKVGFLRRESRGVYVITDEGRQALAGHHAWGDNKGVQAGAATLEAQTPEERVECAFAELNAALQSDIYERVLAMHDADFERLIVRLMLGLGYGAGGLGKRTGGAGDGAIDGIITEDVLGLDVIYLQAKRYAQDSSIGPDKIREFAGAMDAHGVTKGVFVTTSRYTKAALEYATLSHKRLRLIDGNELTRLMVQHGIGVRAYSVLELKRVDADFFDELGE